jgi:hypothetical protein
MTAAEMLDSLQQIFLEVASDRGLRKGARQRMFADVTLSCPP